MELPTTVTALLIAAFAILPGVPGEKLYSMFVGWDWREDKWSRTLRVLAFSVVGFAVYATIAPAVHVPLPIYISVKAIEGLLPKDVPNVAGAFLGHVVAAAVCGACAGGGTSVIARLAARSPYSSSWDHFINSCVRGHWVTVSLNSGQAYAGYIDKADVSVAANERDIILREPAFYDEAARVYRALPYQTMFLLGSTIAAVASVTDPSLDKRITAVGEELFKREE